MKKARKNAAKASQRVGRIITYQDDVPRGVRTLTGVTSGALLGFAMGGPTGALLGGVAGMVIGASSDIGAYMDRW